KKIDKGSQLLNIEGELLFSLQSSCEGWITDHSFSILYEYQDAAPLKVNNTISTYESYDGQDFQFFASRQSNDQDSEQTNGHLDHSQNIRQVTYTKPEQKILPLSLETLLPMQHTYEILDAAQQGKKFINLPLFDGSNDEGTMDVSAFIISANGSQYHTDPSQSLYKIDLAFFQQNSKTEQAEYEITIYIHKSGIISYMLVNYGDFTIAQKLKSSEILEKTTCKAL
ncbi:MAG: EipB family protein, partial [Bdellovibrionales bacterium]